MAKKIGPMKQFVPAVGLHWDPFGHEEHGVLTTTASLRIKRDLVSIFTEPPPGLFVVGDDSNMRCIHAIIMGVMDTPYEGGFFYFYLRCPYDYPIHPPKVKLMTTDAGRVRFNPNLYKSGKVCLSILGTWEGPAWSPAQQLSSVLISIQSLMNEQPYFNEPGYVKELTPGDAKRYNQYIQYQTLRVAVCGMIENSCSLRIPSSLRDIMEKTFLQFYDQYVEVATNNLSLDGTHLVDLFSNESQVCNYSALLTKLQTLRDSLSLKHKATLVKTPESIGTSKQVK